MKKVFVFIITVLLSIMSLASCNSVSKSSIALELEDLSFSLFAHNANAKKAFIPSQGKSPYMFFSFDDSFHLFVDEYKDTSLALCVDIDFAKDRTDVKNRGKENKIAFGFLTKDDFTSDGLLKTGTLVSRSMVTGFIDSADFQEGMSLSFSLPQDTKIKGFFLYATEDLYLKKARIQKPSLGWSFAEERAFFAFSAMGGEIPSSLAQAQDEGLSLALSSSLELDTKESYLSLAFSPQEQLSHPERYPSVVLDLDKESFTIQRSPLQTKAHIYASQMLSPTAQVFCSKNKEMLIELLFMSNEGIRKKTSTEKSLEPLHTDPGLIIIWDKDSWRQESYELFSWELFPSVLIMDFKNYAIQDDYLKRLAFFAEKKGYTGRLSYDDEIKSMHGFNAHDYSAETLANFFALAEKENFPLNQSELHLRSILLENGVIRFENGKLVEGAGALLSISQESTLALRYTLMGHEAYHGIYFTEKLFRDHTLEVFNASDPNSRDFLMGYFTTSETLNYDIDNDYLLKNEFMAYLLQQSIANTGQYFVNIASRPSVIKNLPELSLYVRNSRGSGFTEACRELDAFIYKSYGLAAGRVRLVGRTRSSF